MAASPETVSMAMFCDFENVALGVRDAKHDKFDIKPVLERLLLKGSIVVKKAYCDWDRYKPFKATMHEANFELIEIPHVRQSGKNSADIRMVVDALDLCYTKAHVNTFVIVSGDSDFSPLVSKLRENAKYVIGVGVRQSTSDLLIANCDEFIFYDDLVRESQRAVTRRDPKAVQSMPRLSREELEERKSQAVELAVSTFEALAVERGESGKIWASMLKEAMKRRKPDFNESHFGFRSFGNLLDEAQARGLLEVGRDEKSGAFVSRSAGNAVRFETPLVVAEETVSLSDEPKTVEAPAAEEQASPPKRRSRGRGKGAGKDANRAVASVESAIAAATTPEMPAPASETAGTPESASAVLMAGSADASPEPSGEPVVLPEGGAEPETATPKRAASRGRRPRKPKASPSPAE
jgi:uncharacterized LabA/DUF88 family protein